MIAPLSMEEILASLPSFRSAMCPVYLFVRKTPSAAKPKAKPKAKRATPKISIMNTPAFKAWRKVFDRVKKDLGIPEKSSVMAQQPAHKIVKELKERVKKMHPNLDTLAVYEKVGQMYQSGG